MRKVALWVSSQENDVRLRSFQTLLYGDLNAYSTRHNFTFPALQRQRDRLRKKMRISDNAEELRTRAINDFIEVNRLAGNVSVKINPQIVDDARHFIWTALNRFTRNHTNDSSEVLNLTLLLTLWKHGPGSFHGNRVTHFVDKICHNRKGQSVTSRAQRFADLLLKVDPHLSRYFADSGIGFKNVEGSRLSTVAKNEETQRTIAKEPLWNMALQLAAGAYIEGGLQCVGLDLSTQPELNKRLAWVGSVTNGLATIDLKSASDLITPALIELLWPRSWFCFLSAIRSERIKVPGHGWIDANMMSTMGNGFTFPMMTLTLLSLVYACQSHRIRKSMYWNKQDTGVFGDDIIVPSEDYESVCAVLHGAGLIVNTDKSYHDGPFRESCGGDFWTGLDITPFYPKSLGSEPEVYIAINQLLDWSGYHRIPLVDSFEYLLSLIDKKPFFVPIWSQPFQGIRTKEVSGRYKQWDIYSSDRKIDLERINPIAAIKIILYGAVTSTKHTEVCPSMRNPSERYVVTYTPRTDRPIYRFSEARLPRGFLDGSAPQLRSTEVSEWIDQVYLVPTVLKNKL